MIVIPDVVDVYISLKKQKHPKKCKETTTYWKPKEYQILKC